MNVLPTYIHVYTCVWCLWKGENSAWGHQELELQMTVSHYVCLDSNLGPLQEQGRLLTAEPSLQPLDC